MYSDRMNEITKIKRKIRIILVSEGITDEIKNLIKKLVFQVSCPIQEKFSVINVEKIIIENFQEEIPLDRVILSIHHLIKYGLWLLKSEEVRPLNWKEIILDPEWNSVAGLIDILYALGFMSKDDNCVEFPLNSEPDSEVVSLLITELMLLVTELEEFYDGSHPHSSFLIDLMQRCMENENLDKIKQSSFITFPINIHDQTHDNDSKISIPSNTYNQTHDHNDGKISIPTNTHNQNHDNKTNIPMNAHNQNHNNDDNKPVINNSSNKMDNDKYSISRLSKVWNYVKQKVGFSVSPDNHNNEAVNDTDYFIKRCSDDIDDDHKKNNYGANDNESNNEHDDDNNNIINERETLKNLSKECSYSKDDAEKLNDSEKITLATETLKFDSLIENKIENESVSSLNKSSSPKNENNSEEKLSDMLNEQLNKCYSFLNENKQNELHLVYSAEDLNGQTLQDELMGSLNQDQLSSDEVFDKALEEDILDTSDSEKQTEMVLKKIEKEQPRVRDGLHCDLCGCSAPAVRCEKCSHQIFCLSCDDMYHRHPKRRTHARKAVNIPPPPPPKPVKDADPTRLPVPPPRRRKSQSNQKSVPSSPLFSRKTESQNPPLPKKEFSFIDKVGSLKRFMIGRPLPPVPKDEAPERPPKTSIWKQLEQNSTDKNQITNENDEMMNSYSNMSKRAETLVPNSNENATYENDITENPPNFPPSLNNTVNKVEQNSNDWDRSSQERRSSSGIEEWTNNSSKQSSESQFSYPSTLTKSEVDSGIQMGFQGFPTLPKRTMYPTNQYMDRSVPPMPMNHQGGSACNLTNPPNMPQHLLMHMPQGQPFQGMGYMHPNHMPRNDGQFPHPCTMPYSMPWMAHPQDPYKYYMDPSMQSYPGDVKRIPSSSSINFSPTGSEAGYRLNSYTSMGHLHNPSMMDGLAHHYPPSYAHNNRPPSPAQSVRSSRLHKAQSIASDVGSSVFYHGGRRATAHGFPFSGRHSNLEGTSSEEDYFSAGASDDEDFRSIRSGPTGYGKTHVPSRNWQCEHCTFVNSPGSRICSVCCKTTARPKSMVSRRRRGASGTKTPSSSDSLPPIVPKQNHRKRSTPNSPLQDMPSNDEAINDENVESDKELSTAMDSNLQLNENIGNISETINGSNDTNAQEVSTESNEQILLDANSRPINKSASESKSANEKNKNLHTNTASTGTSPPPQHSATQTGLMEEMASDDFSQRTLFRSTSRTSLSGADREIIPHLRRTASVHIGPNDSWNVPYGHRSSSRASLFGGSRDTSPLRSFRGDVEYNGYRDRRYSYEPLNRTDYYLSLEELIERRRQETMRVQGFELVRLLREAEQNNFNADDLQVALNHCGSQNPIQWLQDNWKNMIDTVVTLVSNYGKDKDENDIGIISLSEGKEALRLHKGNIWAAVTDCVEIRQKKFAELKSRGDHFAAEEIVAALTASQGNVEGAYLELSKNSMKPFHMKIWGPPLGVENESGSKKTSSKSPSTPRSKSPISPSVITGTLTIPFGARTSMEAGSSSCEATADAPIAASSSTSTTTVTVTTATSQPTVTSSVHIGNTSNEASSTEVKDLQHSEREKTTSESSFTSVIQEIIAADEGSGESTTSWRIATPGGGSARCARMLLAEGKVATYEEGELAVKLLELKFEEQDAFTAASECNDLDSAVAFLQQECELCANRYPMGKMVSMLNCIHRCCRECARAYFSLQIRDKNIMEAVCPYCSEPDLSDENVAQEYFNHLDIMLKNLVKPDVHELFQRKLRDRALMKDPNFHWCSQCSSGFIAPPNTKRLICPDCHIITCSQCRKVWEKQHEGISCERFANWKEENDPEFQAKGLEKHLEENGIDCPNCRFRYSLAKGGCMHFICLQCKHDFCSGCGQPFKMGQKCIFSDHCAKLGLHAHHPRNCLFYLRDKEPADLQKLLKENNITFDTEVPLGSASALTEQSLKKCPVMEQKDIPEIGLKDDICGKDVEEGYAGLCRIHYIEYLGNFIKKYNIDPVVIYTEDDLEACLRRSNIRLPARLTNQTRSDYQECLKQMIKEQIPLDETARS